MKVRCGFVSNSSSSSFVLLVGKVEKCPTCGIKLDILDIVSRTSRFEADTQIILEGKREFEEKIKDLKETAYHSWRRYGKSIAGEKFYFESSLEYKEVQDLEKAIEESEKEENNDFELVYIELSSRDELANSVLNHLIESGRVKEILRREG